MEATPVINNSEVMDIDNDQSSSSSPSSSSLSTGAQPVNKINSNNKTMKENNPIQIGPFDPKILGSVKYDNKYFKGAHAAIHSRPAGVPLELGEALWGKQPEPKKPYNHMDILEGRHTDFPKDNKDTLMMVAFGFREGDPRWDAEKARTTENTREITYYPSNATITIPADAEQAIRFSHPTSPHGHPVGAPSYRHPNFHLQGGNGKNGDTAVAVPNIMEPSSIPINQDVPVPINEEVTMTINQEIPVTIGREIPMTINKEASVTMTNEAPIATNKEFEDPISINENVLVTGNNDEIPKAMSKEDPVTTNQEVSVTTSNEVPITINKEVAVPMINLNQQTAIAINDEIPTPLTKEASVIINKQVPITFINENQMTMSRATPYTSSSSSFSSAEVIDLTSSTPSPPPPLSQSAITAITTGLRFAVNGNPVRRLNVSDIPTSEQDSIKSITHRKLTHNGINRSYHNYYVLFTNNDTCGWISEASMKKKGFEAVMNAFDQSYPREGQDVLGVVWHPNLNNTRRKSRGGKDLSAIIGTPLARRPVISDDEDEDEGISPQNHKKLRLNGPRKEMDGFAKEG